MTFKLKSYFQGGDWVANGGEAIQWLSSNRTVWRNVGIKVAKFFPNSCPKIAIAVFSKLFLIAQNGTKYLGNICENICHQELSKIDQSGHTGTEPPRVWLSAKANNIFGQNQTALNDKSSNYHILMFCMSKVPKAQPHTLPAK